MAAPDAPSSTGDPEPANPLFIRRTLLRMSLSDLPPSPPSPSPVAENMASGWDEPGDIPNPPGSPFQGVFAADAREVALAQEQALAATYDALVQEIALLRARPDTDEASSGSDDSLASDNALHTHMLWFQDYLEFVLLQRGCSQSRSARGLPPQECTRHSPCNECRQHEGSCVPSSFWHSLSDEEVDLHLAQYLRVKDQLPEWRSSHPSHIAPPHLQFGATASPSASDTATPVPASAPTSEDNAPGPAPAAPASGVDGNFIGRRAADPVPAAEIPISTPAAPAASSGVNAAPGPGHAAESPVLNLVAMIAEPLFVAPRGFPIPMRLLLNDAERVLLERNVEEARPLWGRYLALPSTVALFNVIFDCARVHEAPVVALAFVLPEDAPNPSTDDVPDLESTE